MHLRHPARTPSSPSPNRDTFERREIVDRYARSTELYPAEAEIFQRYSRQFGGNVLDIAIGAGRTTRALLHGCKRYLGLDLSDSMVEVARANFPEADLRVMDMREAPTELAADRFDAILVSFNSLDYIPWKERCELLLALPGLLAPGGVFVFSTHDLASAPDQRRFQLRADLRHALHSAYRPRSLAKLLLRAPPTVLKAWRNRLHNRGMESTFEDYAYVNDDAEDYGLLTLYVSTTRQIELLKGSGFSRIVVMQPWLRSERAYFNYFACQV